MDGFMPYLLLQSKDIFENGTPSMKLTPVGFLSMLLAQDRPTLVESSTANGSGHLRDIKFKYRNRITAGKSVTTDDCEINSIPAFLETSIPGFLFRKYTVHFDDATIAKYEEAASKIVAAGSPTAEMPQEMWNALLEAANGLFADINNDLLSSQAATFGINKTTAASTPKTVNFRLDATQNDLSSGMTQVMDDLMQNEIRLENAIIVGSGLINKYYLQNKAKSADITGLDTSKLALPKYFYDPYAENAWGVNQFGIFEKNAVQLVNINKFNGFRGGDKMVAKFGTITLPVTDTFGNGGLGSFKFDYQLEYNKCPGNQSINGESTPVDRGWDLTLMCNYNLFNIPADAYAGDDVLTGNNGSLLYEATNS